MEISDHFPLEITIKVLSQKTHSTRSCQVWNKNSKIAFIRRMESSRNPQDEDWRTIRSKMIAATERKEIALGNTSKNKWWNKDCYIKRKAMNHKLHQHRGSKSNSHLQEYKVAKAEYKAAVKTAKAEEKFRIEEQLEKVRSVS